MRLHNQYQTVHWADKRQKDRQYQEDQAIRKRQADAFQAAIGVALKNELSIEMKRLAQDDLIPSGNGLIGGAAWIVGYHVPAGSPSRLREKAAEMLRQQMALAGRPYNEAVDFERFNFVLGIAASASIVTDLRRRFCSTIFPTARRRRICKAPTAR